MPMNFDTYERRGRASYAAFAESVANVLTAAIKTQPNIRLQDVQRRAKDPASLKKKLGINGAAATEDIESAIKDLAGCRLVFYTNSDVSRFLSSGLVGENFDIVWDKTKIHHPTRESSRAAELFISDNYVVKLNVRRNELPEYTRFQGMLCEVQVQTTLNHAWSEMAHDTIYKKPSLEGFGASLMKGIEDRMKIIMQKYLLPAGFEFQKVVNDFENLSNGKELVEQRPLEAIRACADNNALYELLQKFFAYVLPHYDDLQSIQAEVRSTVVAAVLQARTRDPVPMETQFGALAGYSAEQIAEVATNIIDHLRYLSAEATESTFEAICTLFASARSETEKARMLRSAHELARHNVAVWKSVGPLVQFILVKSIRRLDADARSQLRPVVVKVLSEVLRPEISGMSMASYNTFEIQSAPAAASEMLTELRREAIEIFQDLFRDASTDAERRSIVQHLAAATTTPYRGNYSNELFKTILENTKCIVDFYRNVAADQSCELIREIEEDLLWLYRRSRSMPADIEAEIGIATAAQNLVASILAFRDLVNSSREFVIYKTLVGYNSVFAPAWEDDELYPGFDDEYRNRLITDLVTEIEPGNADEWLTTLTKCALTESSDMATFLPFERFLTEFGKTHPDILCSYFDRLDDRLAGFLPSMLLGLESGEGIAAASGVTHQWIRDRTYLGQIIRYLRFTGLFESGLLEDALRAAIQTGDSRAVMIAVDTAAARHKDVTGGLIDRAFMPAIGYLAEKTDTSWAGSVWQHSLTDLIKDFTSNHVDFFLACLVPHPTIDHHVEMLLETVAASWPEQVADFFGSRLDHEIKGNSTNYEAVPFRFFTLHKSLNKIPGYLVNLGRSRFSQDGLLAEYRAGRLIAISFPTFSSELEQCLQAVVHQGGNGEIKFVLSILRNYRGETFIHEVVKSIVSLLDKDDPVLGEIDIILDLTGVVGGEFGFVEAYARKRSEIETWLTDSREPVQSFAKRHIASLSRQIAREQRRSEQEVELRKLNYED
jgi:ppGpp synthetase/RelA/SpoT-type nucleotidyltranferase